MKEIRGPGQGKGIKRSETYFRFSSDLCVHIKAFILKFWRREKVQILLPEKGKKKKKKYREKCTFSLGNFFGITITFVSNTFYVSIKDKTMRDLNKSGVYQHSEDS